MSNQIKQLRGQLRQIAKEFLPEALKQELYIKIQEQVTEGLKEIKEQQDKALEQMKQHQKDVLAFLIRQTTNSKSE